MADITISDAAYVVIMRLNKPGESLGDTAARLVHLADAAIHDYAARSPDNQGSGGCHDDD